MNICFIFFSIALLIMAVIIVFLLHENRKLSDNNDRLLCSMGELRARLNTDVLTKSGSRDAYNTMIWAYNRKMKELPENFVVINIDINNLKQVNDQ